MPYRNQYQKVFQVIYPTFSFLSSDLDFESKSKRRRKRMIFDAGNVISNKKSMCLCTFQIGEMWPWERKEKWSVALFSLDGHSSSLNLFVSTLFSYQEEMTVSTPFHIHPRYGNEIQYIPKRKKMNTVWKWWILRARASVALAHADYNQKINEKRIQATHLTGTLSTLCVLQNALIFLHGRFSRANILETQPRPWFFRSWTQKLRHKLFLWEHPSKLL